MSNETQVEKVLRLKKAEYSVRAIAKNIGISKSQVQRILEENKKNEPSQMVSQVSPNNSGTDLEVSQNVSQVSQRDLEPFPRVSQTVSQAIRDRQKEELKTERELKKWETKFKNQFDVQLQILLIQKDFSSSELDEQINFFTDGKGNVDTLSHQSALFTGEDNFEFSNFLKDLLIHLRKAHIKMESFKYKELKLDREFTFEKGLRFVEVEEHHDEEEYDDDFEDEEQDEPQEETVIVVKLWNRYNSSLKSTIESKIKQDGLGFKW